MKKISVIVICLIVTILFISSCNERTNDKTSPVVSTAIPSSTPVSIDYSYLNEPTHPSSTPVLTKTTENKPKTSAPVATVPASKPHTRITTGQDKTLAFEKGATVYGSTITINGVDYYNGYIVNASASGYVTTGVIWPWASEIANATKLTEVTASPNPTPSPSPESTPVPSPTLNTRVASGQGQSIKFEKGATVYGSVIIINGTSYYDGYIINASAAGTVTTGVVWPWASEIANATKLTELRPKIIVTNSTVTFNKGDNVYGQIIIITGNTTTYLNTYIINANASGTVTNGIINPNSCDIPSGTTTITFP